MLGSTNTDKVQPLAFTLDKKILDIIAQGDGPKEKLITLGMSNWEQGQLEAELDATPPRKANMSWLVIPYDYELVFGPKREDMWEMCVSRAVQNTTTELTNKIFKD